VFEGRGRLLVVQKTGWGKSFVYFIATKLLREAGNGPALLISPLLALMRNQIAAAERMGVQALTINSDNEDEWSDIEAAIGREMAINREWQTRIERKGPSCERWTARDSQASCC
jgi:ATP-dependent DNA helicase RecQ